MPSLADRLHEHIAAAFTGLWVQTHEPQEAQVEIARLCSTHNWALAVWDVDQGLQLPRPPEVHPEEDAQSPATPDVGSDPLAAIRALGSLVQDDAGPAATSTTVLIMHNLHRFLGSVEVVQALCHQLHQGKQHRAFIVALCPTVQLPLELERRFVVLEHDLPDREQLRELIEDVASEPDDLPDGDAREALLDAAAGLTRLEAEGAVALSLVRHDVVQADTLWELKTQALKKSGLLQLHRGSERFDDLGGLDALKQFCSRAMARRDTADVRPRGVLLLGVPGTGKSAFAKALGNETGRPTLTLDVGALMGSLVGQTEQNVRRALGIVDAMAPCICFVDEIEKALSGVQASGQTDSGVSARLFGSLLTWLSDHDSDVFFIATCNDISRLPPEFSRAERFDGVFFLDLPTTAEKAAIWQLYLEKFQLDADQPRPSDTDWTGAEIRACCRLARLLGVTLMEASAMIVPVAVTAHDQVGNLRRWADRRCLSAHRAGVYVMPKGETSSRSTGRRAVARPAANN